MTPEQRQLTLGTPDIQVIVLHELGHCAGIGHCNLTNPVMTGQPYGLDSDPYNYREVKFDDSIAIQMAYAAPFDRLGRAGIYGRLYNGDAMDGVDTDLALVKEIELQPVFLGRPLDQGTSEPDELFGVDQTTSFTRKIRFFAEVLASPIFSAPLGIEAPIVFDNRYFFPGLPLSTQPLPVAPGVTLLPNDYVVFIQPGNISFSNDQAQINYATSDFLYPAEFYGGLVAPFNLPGDGTGLDSSAGADFRVQNRYLVFSYNNLGQFNLAINNNRTDNSNNYALLGETLDPPFEGYATYRVIQGGTTLDVPNYGGQNIIPVDPRVPMREDDLRNTAIGQYRIANALLTTETLELGAFRDPTTTGADFRVTILVENTTAAPIEAGLRYLMKPVLLESQSLHSGSATARSSRRPPWRGSTSPRTSCGG